jgi:polyhydroxyalkanoate synthesis regulator phasin
LLNVFILHLRKLKYIKYNHLVIINIKEAEMTNPGKEGALDNEAKQARGAVEHGVNIRESMRDITLAALSRGRLEAEEMRRVVRSVMQGASLGLSKAGDKSREAMGEALAGIDDALAKSAEATRLAVEEAAGKLKDYGKQDLEQSFEDLRTLEKMFLDTLKDVTAESAGTAKEVLQDLWPHARDSGTTAGATAKEAIVNLERKLGRTLREIASAGHDAALNTTAKLADAAAGFLAGISETLSAKAKNMQQHKK